MQKYIFFLKRPRKSTFFFPHIILPVHFPFVLPSLILRYAFGLPSLLKGMVGTKSELRHYGVIRKAYRDMLGKLSPEFFISLINHLTSTFGACLFIPDLDVIAHTLWT